MTVKQVSDLSLRKAGKAFINSLLASNSYSTDYVKSLQETIGYIAVYSEGQDWPSVGDITIEHIEAYFSYSRTRKKGYGERRFEGAQTLSSSYLNRQYRQLNRFWEWLVERDLAERNVMRLMRPPRVEERTVPTLGDPQLQSLLALLNPNLGRTPAERFRMVRDRAVVLLFIDTPGRRSEIAKISLDGASPEEGWVHVMGKGGKERNMPLGRTAQWALAEYLEARSELNSRSQDLWLSGKGEGMKAGWVYSMIKRLGARAGIPHIKPHMFRHTFAVHAVREKMQEPILKNIGGWKKIPETYFRTIGFEDAQAAHKGISPGDRLSHRPSSRIRNGDPGTVDKKRPRGRL